MCDTASVQTPAPKAKRAPRTFSLLCTKDQARDLLAWARPLPVSVTEKGVTSYYWLGLASDGTWMVSKELEDGSGVVSYTVFPHGDDARDWSCDHPAKVWATGEVYARDCRHCRLIHGVLKHIGAKS